MGTTVTPLPVAQYIAGAAVSHHHQSPATSPLCPLLRAGNGRGRLRKRATATPYALHSRAPLGSLLQGGATRPDRQPRPQPVHRRRAGAEATRGERKEHPGVEVARGRADPAGGGREGLRRAGAGANQKGDGDGREGVRAGEVAVGESPGRGGQGGEDEGDGYANGWLYVYGGYLPGLPATV